MKNMKIYEPAMCCPTGLCGVGIDDELLRISTVLSNLEKNGITVERLNLTNSALAFIGNIELYSLIVEKGIEILPVTTLDGEIVKTGSYPTNKELIELLEVPENFIEEIKLKKNNGHFLKVNRGCC